MRFAVSCMLLGAILVPACGGKGSGGSGDAAKTTTSAATTKPADKTTAPAPTAAASTSAPADNHEHDHASTPPPVAATGPKDPLANNPGARVGSGPHGGLTYADHDHLIEYIHDPATGTLKVWVLENDNTILPEGVVTSVDAKITIAIDPETKELQTKGDNTSGYLVQDDFLKSEANWIAKMKVTVTDHGPEPVDHPFRFSYPPGA